MTSTDVLAIDPARLYRLEVHSIWYRSKDRATYGFALIDDSTQELVLTANALLPPGTHGHAAGLACYAQALAVCHSARVRRLSAKTSLKLLVGQLQGSVGVRSDRLAPVVQLIKEIHEEFDQWEVECVDKLWAVLPEAHATFAANLASLVTSSVDLPPSKYRAAALQVGQLLALPGSAVAELEGAADFQQELLQVVSARCGLPLECLQALVQRHQQHQQVVHQVLAPDASSSSSSSRRQDAWQERQGLPGGLGLADEDVTHPVTNTPAGAAADDDDDEVMVALQLPAPDWGHICGALQQLQLPHLLPVCADNTSTQSSSTAGLQWDQPSSSSSRSGGSSNKRRRRQAADNSNSSSSIGGASAVLLERAFTFAPPQLMMVKRYSVDQATAYAAAYKSAVQTAESLVQVTKAPVERPQPAAAAPAAAGTEELPISGSRAHRLQTARAAAAAAAAAEGGSRQGHDSAAAAAATARAEGGRSKPRLLRASAIAAFPVPIGFRPLRAGWAGESQQDASNQTSNSSSSLSDSTIASSSSSSSSSSTVANLAVSSSPAPLPPAAAAAGRGGGGGPLDALSDLCATPHLASAAEGGLETFSAELASEVDKATHVLQFDGASKGNPGRAGWGYVLYDTMRGAAVARGCLSMPYGATAAEAEFQGALEGIQAALKRGIRSLAIQGDSTPVMTALAYKRPGLRVRRHFVDATTLLQQLEHVEVLQIPRELNKAADRLANIALALDSALYAVLRKGLRGEAALGPVLKALKVQIAGSRVDRVLAEAAEDDAAFLLVTLVSRVTGMSPGDVLARLETKASDMGDPNPWLVQEVRKVVHSQQLEAALAGSLTATSPHLHPLQFEFEELWRRHLAARQYKQQLQQQQQQQQPQQQQEVDSPSAAAEGGTNGLQKQQLGAAAAAGAASSSSGSDRRRNRSSLQQQQQQQQQRTSSTWAVAGGWGGAGAATNPWNMQRWGEFALHRRYSSAAPSISSSCYLQPLQSSSSSSSSSSHQHEQQQGWWWQKQQGRQQQQQQQQQQQWLQQQQQLCWWDPLRTPALCVVGGAGASSSCGVPTNAATAVSAALGAAAGAISHGRSLGGMQGVACVVAPTCLGAVASCISRQGRCRVLSVAWQRLAVAVQAQGVHVLV